MLSCTPIGLRWLIFPSRGGYDMHRLLEVHFWSLTRYRILPHFLGLDYAGNIIFFPSYRKQRFGGWGAVTLGAPGGASAGFLSPDTKAMNVLEDGYPMHYKASRKLQDFIAQERRRWKASETTAAKPATDNANPSSSDPKASTAVSGTDIYANYDSDQKFRDIITVKFSNPRFYNRTLCINPLATLAYKFFYFYIWAVFISLALQGYLMFRAWVNPPAREGLKNIESHVLHIPRLIFAGGVNGIAWLVRCAQPVIDPVVHQLAKWFPQVNWYAASAENLASRAETLANDAHPASKLRKEQERRRELIAEHQRRVWWTRILVVLLLIFSVLCVL